MIEGIQMIRPDPKKKKVVKKKKDGRGGKRKGAGRKIGPKHEVINFRILSEKKKKFKKAVKQPNKEFNAWVDTRIEENTVKPDPRGVL